MGLNQIGYMNKLQNTHLYFMIQECSVIVKTLLLLDLSLKLKYT